MALAGREPLQTWTLGNVALFGDAAHPIQPFLAHGAIMALEDAFVLARSFDEHSGSPAEALKCYERTRVERTTKIVRESAKTAGRFHNPVLSDPVKEVAYIDAEWAPETVRARYDRLFEFDATPRN